MWFCFFQTTIFQSLTHLHLSCIQLARIIFHNWNKCHLLCNILLGRAIRLNFSSKRKKPISLHSLYLHFWIFRSQNTVRFFFFFLPKCKKDVIYVFKSIGESFTYSFRSNIVPSHNHIQSTVRPTQQSLYEGTNEQPSSEINTALNARGHDVTKPPLKIACLEARASFIIETIL